MTRGDLARQPAGILGIEPAPLALDDSRALGGKRAGRVAADRDVLMTARNATLDRLPFRRGRWVACNFVPTD